MNEKEERYVKLSEKAYWEPLTDIEQEEVEGIQKQLKIKPCTTCEGQGWFEVPGMMGGWENYPCKTCEGTGIKGQSIELHLELLKAMPEH
jgi:DnaJ-class molecular chaperone